MSKVIALFALASLMFLSQLGNFWFTYGIWPKSWGAYFLFSFAGLVLYAATMAVTKED